MELIFEDTQLQTRFVIARTLSAIVGNKVDYDMLRPTAPYVPRYRGNRQPATEVVEGVMPPAVRAVPYVVELPHASIASSLLSTLSTGSQSQILARVKTVFLPRTFDTQSYARFFKHLLWIEEFKMEYVSSEDLYPQDVEHFLQERPRDV